jgi:cell shape-determining protein MreC
MAVHIGKIIAQKAKDKELGATALAKKINTTPQNMYTIYKRQTIDTGLLLKLSEALQYNFFIHYEKDKTMIGIANSDTERLEKENTKLKEQLQRTEEKLNMLTELSEQQKKNIKLLEAAKKR